MQNARLGEAQAGIKIDRRKISNLRYPNDTYEKSVTSDIPLMAERKEELKNL